ncbi:MAG TPA: DUF1559 domain-containing protein [Lacipirellulaceae bacterium]
MKAKLNVCLVCFGGLVVLVARGMAAEPADVLAPFVNGDPFAAAFIDMRSLPEKADGSFDVGSLLPLVGDERQPATAALRGAQQLIDALRKAGVDRVYAVAGLADIHERGGPLVLLQLKAGRQPENVVRKLSQVAPLKVGQSQVEMRPHGSNEVLVGLQATVERYASLARSERPDVINPLERLSNENAKIAAVFCPGPDFRRVVRELWPELPGPLAPLRGELADRWLHLELSTNLPPKAKPQLTVQARDEEAATIFAQLWRDLPTAVPTMTGEANPKQTRQYVQAVVEALPPKLQGDRVTLAFPTTEAELAALQRLASQATDAAMESARRDRRVNQFKHLALAALNYHDQHKHFPASAAIRSKDGEPLLSWRVALLPYLEQGELYKQFHLDEPWDSPHNRTLIEKMPEIFADPDRKLRHLAREGKTTCQVPVGPATVFPGNGGITFRDIADGTSKTIMIVEVEPLRAVVWTKPEDWEPDMENPLRGVARSDRDIFVAAWCDGSVQAVAVDIDKDVLRAHLTRAGREVVDRP